MLSSKSSFAVALILAILAQNVFASGFFNCKYSNTNCMLELANSALKELRSYVPKYDIKPWEPVEIEDMNITISTSETTHISLFIKELQLYGLTEGQIGALNYIPIEGQGHKDFYLDAHSSYERLSFRGKYTLNATVNALDYIGDGDLVQNYHHVDCFSKFLLASDFKAGETHFNVKNPLIKCGHNRGDFHLWNLSIGRYLMRDYEMDDPWLTPIFMKFFDNFAKVVASDLQKLFQKVSYEHMFLTDPFDVEKKSPTATA